MFLPFGSLEGSGVSSECVKTCPLCLQPLPCGRSCFHRSGSRPLPLSLSGAATRWLPRSLVLVGISLEREEALPVSRGSPACAAVWEAVSHRDFGRSALSFILHASLPLRHGFLEPGAWRLLLESSSPHSDPLSLDQVWVQWLFPQDENFPRKLLEGPERGRDR